MTGRGRKSTTGAPFTHLLSWYVGWAATSLCVKHCMAIQVVPTANGYLKWKEDSR